MRSAPLPSAGFLPILLRALGSRLWRVRGSIVSTKVLPALKLRRSWATRRATSAVFRRPACYRFARNGIYRFRPHEVAEVARKLGRVTKTDGQTAARVYRHFLAPGFKPTNEAIGLIVVDTGEHPDLVLALWEKFKAGAGSQVPDAEAKEMERLAREYDEQIAAMDEELARKRRGAFIPGDPRDEVKKPRRTGT
jgi:hypothetical protein